MNSCIRNILFITFCSLRALFPVENSESTKIGLALSGGGIRGIAHIGVLRRLEEEGIEIGMISGSSMGALIGSLYALGYDSYEIEAVVKHGLDGRELFTNRPDRDNTENYLKRTADRTVIEMEFTDSGIHLPNALNNGHRVEKKLRELFFSSEYYNEDFDALKYPLRVVCSDIHNGEKVVFDRGNLPTIVMGSISFPGLFRPVKYKHMKLLDGGLTDNLPTGILSGCDVIIASNMTYDTPSRPGEYNFIELLDRISLTMTKAHIEQNIEKADLVFRPQLDDIRFSDIENPDSLIAIGYREACRNMEKLKSLLDHREFVTHDQKELPNEIVITGNTVFSDDHLIKSSSEKNIVSLSQNVLSKYRSEGFIFSTVDISYGASSDTLKINEGFVKRVSVTGNKRTRSKFVRDEVFLRNDRPVTLSEIERGVDNLYGSGLFHKIGYIVDHYNQELTFVVEEKPHIVARLGANYQTDRGFLGLLEISNKNLHGKRAEIYAGVIYGEKFNRIELSYYNPFLRRSTLFFELQPYIQFKEKDFYDNEYRKIREASFNEKRVGAKINLGFQLFDNYQSTFSLVQEKITGNDLQDDRTSAVFSVLADSRNDYVVPSRGVYFTWNIESGIMNFETDKAFQKTWWEFTAHGSVSKRIITEIGVSGGTGDNLVPASELFSRGGFNMIPGTYNGQFISGQYFSLKAKSTILITSSVFADTYFSTGYHLNGFWDSPEIEWHPKDFINSFSAGIILNTTLGPIESGWGLTAGNGSIRANNRFFLTVGYNLL